MGNRSQIAIKQDEKTNVYLYSHWGGADIYKDLQTVIKAGARLDDPEYLARIIFREMGAAQDGETGYGISTSMHEDVQHAIPIVDCETQTITFEHKKRGTPASISFKEFASLPPATFESW